MSAPLVTTSISRTTSGKILLGYRSLKVKREGTGNREATPPDRSGAVISGFSAKSRSRLRLTACDAFPVICSQFGMTYHDTWPTDGRLCKLHLETFLRQLRRWAPEVNYLWLLEFQKRHAPHFHLFLTINPSADLHRKMAQAWVKITGGSEQALRFHEHGNNWIPWDINNGNYLCKYLDKDAQKHVPQGYVNFGRFWGNSQNLVPPPVERSTDELAAYDRLDPTTGEFVQGENYMIRNLGRLAEKQTNGYSRFRKRALYGSYTILNGAAGFAQLERYLSRHVEHRKEVKPCKIPDGSGSSAPSVGNASGPIR